MTMHPKNFSDATTIGTTAGHEQIMTGEFLRLSRFSPLMSTKALSTWINHKYLDPAVQKAMRKNYGAATPYPHAAFTSFLQENQAKRLRKALLRQEYSKKESDLFSLWQTMDLSMTKDPVIASFAAMVESKEFAKMMENLTGVHVKPGAVDLFGAVYSDGDYLLCHDDQVEKRKIAYVLNLSEGFTAKTGGALTLRKNKNGKPGDIAKRIIPKWNTLACFTVSAISHHQVEEVLQPVQRLTIGGWLRG